MTNDVIQLVADLYKMAVVEQAKYLQSSDPWMSEPFRNVYKEAAELIEHLVENNKSLVDNLKQVTADRDVARAFIEPVCKTCGDAKCESRYINDSRTCCDWIPPTAAYIDNGGAHE